MIREVGLGYVATWTLVRRAFRKSLGTASVRNREWLFPQALVIGGTAGLAGAVLGNSRPLIALPLGALSVTMGLVLTARIGRLFDHGDFDPD